MSDVLDVDAVSLYLEIQYAPSPYSLVRGVKKIPAGHLLRFESGKADIKAYSSRLVPARDEAVTAASDVVSVIDVAVSRQLVSDRPLGIFLSGGLDSSIVLHHASKRTPGIRTFSVDYEMIDGARDEGEKFNTDASLAKKTADLYGAKHSTYTISINEIRNNLETIIEGIDEPVANPTAISQYFLSKWVRGEGVVVALGGDGGDELFGGYTRHRMAMLAYYYQMLPNSIQSTIAAVYPRVRKLKTPLGASFHVEMMALNDTVWKGIMKNDLFDLTKTKSFFEHVYAEYATNAHPVGTFMHVDRRTWLPDESLSRSDKTSMRHGLEFRVPLLDIDVVTYADQIPLSRKTDPFWGKKILRDVYRDYLPGYLISQPKRGWISPGAKWLRDPFINAFAREVFSSSYYAGLDGLFDWDAVQDMLQKHVEKSGYYLLPLWNILQLQIWSRKHALRLA